MTDDDEPRTFEQILRRVSLEMYAEGVAIARGLRDGTLRRPPRPFRSVADAAEYAVIGAKGRGWEPAPDVVAMTCGGSGA